MLFMFLYFLSLHLQIPPLHRLLSPSVSLSIYSSIYLSINLSIYPSISKSISLSRSLSLSLPSLSLHRALSLSLRVSFLSLISLLPHLSFSDPSSYPRAVTSPVVMVLVASLYMGRNSLMRTSS